MSFSQDSEGLGQWGGGGQFSSDEEGPAAECLESLATAPAASQAVDYLAQAQGQAGSANLQGQRAPLQLCANPAPLMGAVAHQRWNWPEIES